MLSEFPESAGAYACFSCYLMSPVSPLGWFPRPAQKLAALRCIRAPAAPPRFAIAVLPSTLDLRRPLHLIMFLLIFLVRLLGCFGLRLGHSILLSSAVTPASSCANLGSHSLLTAGLACLSLCGSIWMFQLPVILHHFALDQLAAHNGQIRNLTSVLTSLLQKSVSALHLGVFSVPCIPSLKQPKP